MMIKYFLISFFLVINCLNGADSARPARVSLAARLKNKQLLGEMNQALGVFASARATLKDPLDIKPALGEVSIKEEPRPVVAAVELDLTEIVRMTEILNQVSLRELIPYLTIAQRGELEDIIRDLSDFLDAQKPKRADV